MTFDAYDRSLSLLRTLAPLIKRLRTIDSELAKQLRRAGQSVSLNIAEGNRRTGCDRTTHFRYSLGSAAEVKACLDVGVALGYFDAPQIADALELADRIRAMTYRLSS